MTNDSSFTLKERSAPTTAISSTGAVREVAIRKTRFYLSSSIAALTVFIAANGAAGLALASHMQDSFALQNRDACWWTVKNFKDFQGRPDVVLLGSSLMCRVVNEGDATFLNRKVNALGHFRSEHLEAELAKQLPAALPVVAGVNAAVPAEHFPSLQPRYRTVSLAVGGMNASDVGTLIPQLLVDEKKPAAIVYGIGPRDLFDNSLESPADAPAFRLAEKMNGLGKDVETIARPGRESQFKFAFNQFLRSLLPVYRYQDELAAVFRRLAKTEIDVAVPKPAICNLPAFSVMQQTLLHLLPADIENSCEVKPDDPRHPEHFDFMNNYFMSYNPFRPALYKRQLFFLERFLKYCDQQGIKAVLVKMPLRADNFSLMVPNFYSIYSRDIDRLGLENHATVLDAAKLAHFSDDDFTDTVHLTGRGSCKLIDCISPSVARCLVTAKH